MFYRESGFYKTTYEADMALFPLPIGKVAAAGFAVLFFVICPLVLGEYALSIINIAAIAVVPESCAILTSPATNWSWTSAFR